MKRHLDAKGRWRSTALLALLGVAVSLTWVAASPAPVEAAAQLRSLGGGAWCWFGDPRGVHNNRTYIGWIDQQGDVKVAGYDHATRSRTTAVLR